MSNSGNQNASPYTDLGYPPSIDPHLSHEEADHLMATEYPKCLQAFVDALAMKNPVSTETAAQFLENVVRAAAVPIDSASMAIQMRVNDWDKLMTEQDDLEAVAARAQAYLSTEDGIVLSNFIVGTVSRTSDSMFEPRDDQA